MQSVRKTALDELSKKLGRPVEQVKRKIHAIRSTYNQMRVRVMEAEANGRVYKPMLCWYNDASFLDSVITLRKNRKSLSVVGGTERSSTNAQAKEEDGEEEEQEEEDAHNEQVFVEEYLPRKRLRNSEPTAIRSKVKEDTEIMSLDEHLAAAAAAAVQVEESYPEEEEYESAAEPELEFVMNNRGDFTTATVTTTNTSSASLSNPVQYTVASPLNPPQQVFKDEISLFTELMGSQLRALPESTAVEMMSKIQIMVSQARLDGMMKK